MLTIDIPGFKTLNLVHLVLDYNGTLAIDGELESCVYEQLKQLSEKLQIHVVTADTFGVAGARLQNFPLTLTILPETNQAQAKVDFVQNLRADQVVAIGNGRNDRLMVSEAALGIAVVQREGAASETLHAADVVCPNICSALDLLIHPLRLKATLRS